MSGQDLASFRAPGYQDLPDLDLYMDQVIGVLEKHLCVFFGEEKALTSTMINNYVKNRLLPPPVNKKYNRRHLARLYQLCILKSFMQLSDAAALLGALEKGATPEETHERFRAALNDAMRNVFSGTRGKESYPDPVEKALLAACETAACILRARICFDEARLKETPEKAEKPKKEAKTKKEEKAQKKSS